MIRALGLCLLLMGCAVTPIASEKNGCVGCLVPIIPFSDERPFFLGTDFIFDGEIVEEEEPPSLSAPPSLAALRDQQHQTEQEHADLARYLGTTAWTLTGCCALVLVVLVGQTWWRNRQERGK